MKKYRIFSFFLAVLLLSSLFLLPVHALEEPEITAGAALLMDAANDEVMYEKNARELMYPASLTKVMTALLVIEAMEAGQLTIDQIITAGPGINSDLTADSSTQGIRTGEQMTVKDLMYCLLVASANESANVLADAVAGSRAAFVEKMNQRAQELGCESTHFVNTHGLHDDDHYSTAHDIYLIARQAMTHEVFRTIVSARRYEVPATNMHKSRLFYNTNALLVTWYYHESYIYDKAIGIKTGTTDEGGLCLLSAAEDDDQYLICVVLNAERVKKADGSSDRKQFTETKALYQWGFSNFTRREIVDLDTPLAQVGVTLSEIDHVLVRPAAQIERTLPRSMNLEDIEQTVTLNSDSVQAPVAAGQVLGSLTLRYEGKELGTVDLVAVNDVELSEMLYKIDRMQAFLAMPTVRLGFALLVISFAILLLRLTLFRPRRGSRGRSGYTGRRR